MDGPEQDINEKKSQRIKNNGMANATGSGEPVVNDNGKKGASVEKHGIKNYALIKDQQSQLQNSGDE